jgi:predicted outer membrane repeat protein
LSGDIGTVGAVADNVYNVVSAFSVSGSAVLDGFTVTAGNSNGGIGHGGGIYIQDGSPSFANLVVSNNTASANGGGVFVLSIASLRVNYSSPTFTNVMISNNTSARGGGLYTQNSSPVLFNVTLSGNTATGGAGGGMNNQVLNEATDEYSIPMLTNVTFSGNTANGGGGIFSNHSNPVLTNVTFSGNTANIRGGAILNEGASPVFQNVTFSGNTAPAGLGGTMRNIQNAISAPSHPQFYNSILWGNGSEEITSDGTGSVTLIDSIVQGGCPVGGICTNVINANPNLSTLANNGGFTQTRALGVGSSE